MFELLRQRNFALLWFGQLISIIGDWVLFVALPFYVYELTGSALATGSMFAAQLLPRVLFGSVAGVFVDRWDRKRVMIISDVARGLILLLLLVVQSADWLWIVYLVAFAQSALSQFFMPAKSAIIPLLVEPRDLLKANSLNAVSNSLTRLLGPSLGGVLMATLGLTSVILVDVASFFVSALLLALIVMPARTAPQEAARDSRVAAAWLRFWQEWRLGLRLIRDQRVLLALFMVAALFEIADSVFSSLIVVFVKDVMRGGTQELGWMMAAQGFGGLIGGLLITRAARRVSPVRLIALACFTIGVVDLLIFNLPFVWLAMVLLVPAGVTVLGAMVAMETLMQVNTEDRYRGRIFGAFMTSGALMRLGGTLLSGALSDALNVLPVLQAGALIWLVAGAATLVLLPAQTIAMPAGAPAEPSAV